MRKSILILILILFTSICFAGGITDKVKSVIARKNASGTVCSTSTDSKLIDRLSFGTGDPYIDTKDVYLAVKFTIAADSTITQYVVRYCDSNADTGTVSTMIYDDDGNGATSKPTTIVADTTKTITSSAISAECETATGTDIITLDAPKALSAGTYWLVSKENSLANRGWAYKVVTGEKLCQSTDGASWSCASNYAFQMDVMGCQP